MVFSSPLESISFGNEICGTDGSDGNDICGTDGSDGRPIAVAAWPAIRAAATAAAATAAAAGTAGRREAMGVVGREHVAERSGDATGRGAAGRKAILRKDNQRKAVLTKTKTKL